MLEITSPSLVAGLISAILIAVFGVSVGLLGRSHRAAMAFALYATSFGIVVGLSIIQTAHSRQYFPGDFGLSEVWWYAIVDFTEALFSVLAIVGMVLLVNAHTGKDWRRSRVFWGAIAIGAVAAAVKLATYPNWSGSPTYRVPGYLIDVISFDCLVAAMAGVSIQMGISYAVQPRRDYAIMGAAFAAYPISYPLRTGIINVFDNRVAAWWIIGIVALLAILGVWLWALHRTGNKAAMGVVATALGFAGLGTFLGLYTEMSPAFAARGFDVVLVGYAILRHQYLGLDVRLRWGLSKSTLAVFFVAVFFIVSEAAQTFFGDRYNNDYLGIGAAGLLVLGIAPLQRMADRMAAKAIPGVSATGTKRQLELYRTTVQRFMRDGRLSLDEELHLAGLADELKISAKEVLQTRQYFETVS